MARFEQNGVAQRGWRCRRVLVAALGLGLLPLMGAKPEPQIAMPSQGGQAPSLPGQSRHDQNGPPDEQNPFSTRNLQHLREQERRKRLLTDTAKLVELTNQLKQEVDDTSKDELSLDVVRKAAEIEKLARDVKDRMKS